MNLPAWQQWLLAAGRGGARKVVAAATASVLAVVYGESLHADHHGHWRYNTEWKPIAGFAVYAGGFSGHPSAHAEVERGLSISCPVLVIHAEQSGWPRDWSRR